MRPACLGLALLVHCLAAGLTFSAFERQYYPHIPRAPGTSKARYQGRPEAPQLCVVIRTYWGHGGNDTSLEALIHSLQRQRFSAWEAIIIVMDGKPFEDLPHILQRVNDERVWMFADYIGQQFAPKINGQAVTAYHEKLYNLTDNAIRAYTFLERLMTAGDVDLVAFDYYSRYQRSTGPPCLRFASAADLPRCKDNKLKWCQTDLGANVFNWPRLVAENRRFGTLSAESGGLTADNFDGVLVQKLVSEGWRTHNINDSCLFDHSPSVQRCALEGGVWDDVANPGESPGGNCVSHKEADALLAEFGDSIEEIDLKFSSDGHLAAFTTRTEPAPTTIRCLRYKDTTTHQESMMRFFGARCTHEVDMPKVREFFRRAENAWYGYCTHETDCL
eukprot:jgi/Botrbrau1/11750/Bobra.0195s0075.1